MITDLILIVIYNMIWLPFSYLPIGYVLPSGIHSAVQYASTYSYFLNDFFPVDTLFNLVYYSVFIFILTMTLKLGIFIYTLIRGNAYTSEKI